MVGIYQMVVSHHFVFKMVESHHMVDVHHIVEVHHMVEGHHNFSMRLLLKWPAGQ